MKLKRIEPGKYQVGSTSWFIEQCSDGWGVIKIDRWGDRVAPFGQIFKTKKAAKESLRKELGLAN